MNDETRKLILQYARSFQWTPKNFYWKHTMQVKKFALLIQDKCNSAGTDKYVVEVAAILHDINRSQDITLCR